jgi:3-dehydro-4-phosphotetronate decarboxylase
MLDETELRQQLSEACREVYLREMVSSSGGNLSVRVEDGLLITPTGYSLGKIGPAELVKVELDGKVVGPGKPSKELPFHLQTYLTRSDVGAVVHVHSPYSVSLSCLVADNPMAIPAMMPGYAMRVGRLPTIPFLLPGSRELAAAVNQALTVRDSVMLCKHGIVTVGKDLQTAINLAEEVEENAKIFLLTGCRSHGLTEQEFEQVRNTTYAK